MKLQKERGKEGGGRRERREGGGRKEEGGGRKGGMEVGGRMGWGEREELEICKHTTIVLLSSSLDSPFPILT